MSAQMDVRRFPDYYKAYSWHDKHGLFGYPPDGYPAFAWIRSLEMRFLHYREHPDQAPLFLIREMIQWGGSQNGVLEKFDNALASYCLHTKLDSVLKSIPVSRDAIHAALDIPGLGLAYASKLLRFLAPERYGALDSRIRRAFTPPLPKIFDGNKNSMASGYSVFIEYIESIRHELLASGILVPSVDGVQRQWRAADIEMALFQWSSVQERDSDPPGRGA